MNRESIYTSFRFLECSPETSDAMAEALDGEPEDVIIAVLAWASGMTQKEAAGWNHIPRETFRDFLHRLRHKCASSRYIIPNG